MADNSRHLTYFKVENFKRFESFEMKDLGQFNLIVGDNNVGKTSLLEALLVTEPAWVFANRLFSALSHRNIKTQFAYGDLDYYTYKKISVNELTYSITFKSEFVLSPSQTISLTFDKSKGKIFVKGIENDSTSFDNSTQVGTNLFYNTPFLPFYRGHDTDLTSFYSRLQESKSLKSNFIKSLKVIIPDIADLELSNKGDGFMGTHLSYLIVYQNHIDESLPLAMFGDGTLKLFRILAEIIIHKGHRLMIDEIDAGIHHSRYHDFWKSVIRTALDNDVQLFMTTHNEEFIMFFKEIFETELALHKDKSRVISLVENSTSKQVNSVTYSFEQFEHALNAGNEIRG
jgi:AAA15 family ATPase/GTPase